MRPASINIQSASIFTIAKISLMRVIMREKSECMQATRSGV